MKCNILTYGLLFLSILASFNAQAQRKRDIIFEDKSVGIAVVPSLHHRFISVDNSQAPGFKDSLNKADQFKQALDLGAHFRFKTGRGWYVTTGLYFRNAGFTRVKEDLKLMDEIHPNMPQDQTRIADQLQGFKTAIHYHHNYQYLDLSVLFGKDLTTREMKENEVYLNWFFGGSVSGLVSHHLYLDFVGFTPFGLDYSKIYNTNLNPYSVNMSFLGGLRLDVDVYPKVRLFVKPQIQKYLFFSNNGPEKHHLLSLMAEVGLSYSLGDPKDSRNRTRSL